MDMLCLSIALTAAYFGFTDVNQYRKVQVEESLGYKYDITSMTLQNIVLSVSGADWNYDINSSKGPNHWNLVDAKCAGNRQSPINVFTSNVTYDASLTPLVTLNYDIAMPDVDYTIVNTGHSIAVEVSRNGSWNNSPIVLGHKGIAYRLFQFHFHWGSTLTKGSEHTIDGKAYPAELHIIHYNMKYRTVLEALKMEDGILVWGHLIKVENGSKNTAMEKIINYFSSAMHEGQKGNIPVFPMSDLIVDGSKDNYYNYPGSLTTPNCDETVNWVLNSKFITINLEQIAQFRMLHKYSSTSNSTATIVNNYRPTLPYNGRVVKKSFHVGAGAVVAFPTMTMLIFIMSCLFINV